MKNFKQYINEVDRGDFEIHQWFTKRPKTPGHYIYHNDHHIHKKPIKLDKAIALVNRMKNADPPKYRNLEVRHFREEAEQIGEARRKPYVYPYHNAKTGEHIGYKSSNGYHVKYWRNAESAIKAAKKHAGVDHITDKPIMRESSIALNSFFGIKRRSDSVLPPERKRREPSPPLKDVITIALRKRRINKQE